MAIALQGVESVIFLAGVSGTSAPTAIPLSAVVGIIVGCTCGVLLYYSCAPWLPMLLLEVCMQVLDSRPQLRARWCSWLPC